MYELESMWRNMNPKTNEPTDQEWDDGMDLLAGAVAHMSDVRL